nr:hypothetical protein [archaeon]
MFEFDVRKKYFFILSFLLLILLAMIGVIAFGGNNPSLSGHDGNEIEVVVSGNTMTLQEALDSSGSKNLRCAVPDQYISMAQWPTLAHVSLDCNAEMFGDNWFAVGGYCYDQANDGMNCKIDEILGLGSLSEMWSGTVIERIWPNHKDWSVNTVCCKTIGT